MNGKQIYRGLLVFGAACCLSACLSNSALGVDLVLQATMTGKGDMAGKAQYVLHNKFIQSFRCVAHDMEPGRIYIIVVRRENATFKLAWVRADKRGKGSIELNTKFGDVIPYLRTGDAIQFWTGNSMVMRGAFEVPPKLIQYGPRT